MQEKKGAKLSTWVLWCVNKLSDGISKFMVKQSFVQGKVNGQNMSTILVDHCNFQCFICTTFAVHDAQAQECLFADAIFNPLSKSQVKFEII